MYVVIISLITVFIYLFIYDCCIGIGVIIVHMLTSRVVGNKRIPINIFIAKKMCIIKFKHTTFIGARQHMC
jgi:hypothetical protein